MSAAPHRSPRRPLPPSPARRRADAPAVGAGAEGAAACHPLTERLAERAPTPTQRKVQRIEARTPTQRMAERAQRAGARTPAQGAQRIADRMERRAAPTPRRAPALSLRSRGKAASRIRGGGGWTTRLAGRVAGMRSPMTERGAESLAGGVAGRVPPMTEREAESLAERVAGMHWAMTGRGAARRIGTGAREGGRSRRGGRRRGTARSGRRGSPSRSRSRWRRWGTRSRRLFRNW